MCNASLDSGYSFCVSFWVLFEGLPLMFFREGVTRILRSSPVSPGGLRFTQNGDVRTDDAPVCPSLLHLKSGHDVHEPCVSDSFFDRVAWRGASGTRGCAVLRCPSSVARATLDGHGVPSQLFEPPSLPLPQPQPHSQPQRQQQQQQQHTTTTTTTTQQHTTHNDTQLHARNCTQLHATARNSTQQHATTNKQQTTNNKQQTTNKQTTNNKQQTTNNPTTNNQQPTTNNQQPTTNNQQPTTNNQQPTTNNQHPTTNNQGPQNWAGIVSSVSPCLPQSANCCSRDPFKWL